MDIVMDKEQVSIDLFRDSDTLPHIIRNIASCMPFVVLDAGTVVAQCLVSHKNDVYLIENFYAKNMDIASDLVKHVVEHCRGVNGNFVEMDCGNADIDSYMMLQRLGFRIVGVVPDRYLGSGIASVQNSIVNRDMVQLRIDLNEKNLSTVGGDASGWKTL